MADATGAATIINTAQLDRLVAHLRTCGRFAFDTEFVSEDTFEPVLCLIQVATRAETVVIDPLQVHDLSAFWDVVTDPSVQVVMHAAGEDLRICLLRAGKLPLGVFDVQLAAGFIGYSYPLSLVNLVGQVLGISLAGSETRTDWRRRPLSAAQIQYALDDVRHLLDLADHISGRLEAARPRRLGRGRVSRHGQDNRRTRRGRSMAAPAQPQPAQPPGPGSRPPARRLARRRGAPARIARCAT